MKFQVIKINSRTDNHVGSDEVKYSRLEAESFGREVIELGPGLAPMIIDEKGEAMTLIARDARTATNPTTGEEFNIKADYSFGLSVGQTVRGDILSLEVPAYDIDGREATSDKFAVFANVDSPLFMGQLKKSIEAKKEKVNGKWVSKYDGNTVLSLNGFDVVAEATPTRTAINEPATSEAAQTVAQEA